MEPISFKSHMHLGHNQVKEPARYNKLKDCFFLEGGKFYCEIDLMRSGGVFPDLCQCNVIGVAKYIFIFCDHAQHKHDRFFMPV